MQSKMSEHESLEIIRNMLQQSQRNLREQSIFYLIWGWAVLVASLAEYVMLTVYPSEYHWLVWPVLMGVAGVISMLAGRRLSRGRKVTSFIDGSMGYLWGGFVIYLFFVLLMSHRIGWGSSYLLIIGLYGLATFVSGGILRFRPLIIGGIVSIALALLGMFGGESFSNFPNVLLLLAASITLSYLVPGYMLRAKK